MKIVIVDDSILFLHALGAILKEAGYHDITTFDSAQKAVDFLKSDEHKKSKQMVDIILMDIVLPGMDGIEAVRVVKEDKDLQDIPIIMVSAHDDEEKIEAAFKAGAIDYVNKPIKKVELRARVHSVIKLKNETDSRKEREQELMATVKKLKDALAEVTVLSGLLPICANCKKIRDDKGYWQQVEEYITEHSQAKFSHSICPECAQELYSDFLKLDLDEDNDDMMS